MKLQDLVGKRYGNLVVMYREGTYISPKGGKAVTWHCKCDCGNETVVQAGSLRSGNISSCGCMRSFLGFNEYEEKEDGLYIKVKDQEVIIDKEDLNKFYPYRVNIGKNGYACTKKHSTIHRLIMDCPKGYMVDHINRNKLDNRKCNLRIVTSGENKINSRACSNTGESYIHLKDNKYYIVEVDKVYRGLRYTLEDAIKLRNESLKDTRQNELNYDFAKLDL